MATIPIKLYNRFRATDPTGQGTTQNRFLAGPNGGVPGQPFTPANAGDTAAITLHFLDPLAGDTAFAYHRYPGSTVEVNLYAQGNNHFYGIVTSATELAVTTGVSITRLVAGAPFVIEKQRFVFNGVPVGGTFRLKIQLGTTASINHTAGLYCDLQVPWNITPAGLQDLLRAQNTYYSFFASGTQEAGPVPLSFFTDHGAGYRQREPIVIPDSGGFQIQFGSIEAGTSNNTWLRGIPLIVVEDFNIQYAYGYTINVPLTDPNFIDLFKAANAPAFLDVVLRSPQVLGDNPQVLGGPHLSGQLALVVSDSGVPPSANFNSDAVTGSAPVDIQFFDLSTNSPTSWAWTFGDGGTDTVRNPVHTYVTAGVYTVTLTATNGSGSGSVSKAAFISITGPPPPPPGGFNDCSAGSGTNPGLPCSYFDGPYELLAEVVFKRREMVDGHPDLELWHESYEIRSGSFVRAAVGSVGGFGGRIVKDTPWRPQGSDIVGFDRISHNIPPDRTYPFQLSKSILQAIYTFNGAVLIDIGILNQTEEVGGYVLVHYAMFDPGKPPRIPGIMTIPILNGGKHIDDMGSGFPTSGGLYSNNLGTSYIGGSIENVIGQLWCIKKIYG